MYVIGWEDRNEKFQDSDVSAVMLFGWRCGIFCQCEPRFNYA